MASCLVEISILVVHTFSFWNGPSTSSTTTIALFRRFIRTPLGAVKVLQLSLKKADEFLCKFAFKFDIMSFYLWNTGLVTGFSPPPPT